MLACCSAVAYPDSVADQLRHNLSALNPNLAITNVSSTPVADILAVELGGGEIIYASAAGNYIFTGQLISIEDGQQENLTEIRKRAIRRDVVGGLDPETFITYSATGPESAQIYVFTDTSCGYCQNFHQQIEDINNAGVTVHYLAFPRTGMATAVARLMERAWCSESPQEALTSLKANGRVDAPESFCDAPIARHLQVGVSLGVNGTPYIITADGRNIGGFLSTEKLLSSLQ